MTKATYLVQVVRKGQEETWIRHRRSPAAPPGASSEPPWFVEAVKASNRLEAWILAKRKYPGHLVLKQVVKATR